MSATLGGQARCLVNVNITRDHSKGHGSAALLRTGMSVEVLEGKHLVFVVDLYNSVGRTRVAY